MPRPVPAVRRLVRIAVVAPLATVLILSGCGLGEPRSIEPQGVDGLEIPTPGPDPADFVDAIDNPFLPLAPGSRWVYEQSGSDATITVSVDEATRDVAGVETTAVTTAVSGGADGDGVSTRFYAQDDEGNVWSFGSDDLPVGTRDVQAGLVMPATPRVGDGFLEVYAAGVVESRAEVLDVAATASVPAGSWTDLVEIRTSSPLDPAADRLTFYAPGVGPVRTESAEGVTALVSHTQQDPAP